MSRPHEWVVLLPTWIADEILHVRGPDIVRILTEHAALPTDHDDVLVAAYGLVTLEADAWHDWREAAAGALAEGNPAPARPHEDRLKLSIGRVPPGVRDEIKARADALGFRHPIYAAGVVALAERRRVTELVKDAQ